jgi:phosphohistidine phosphatase
MAVYFVQHGLALSKEKDPNRPLSPEGKRDVERITSYLGKFQLTVREVCHSGKTRALETAQIFSNQFKGSSICQLSGMSPNDDVKETASMLNIENTMYVGHLPHLEKLISYLITGDESKQVIKFVNGGVVCVEKNDSGFYINWYLKPSLCDA